MVERKLLDIFKNFKDDLSVGLVASEQEEIERKRAHQVLMKAKNPSSHENDRRATA